MAIVRYIIVMIGEDAPTREIVVMIRPRAVVVLMTVIVMIMKTGHRYFVIQMTMQALRRRPGKLNRNKQHEKESKETTHGFQYKAVYLAKVRGRGGKIEKELVNPDNQLGELPHPHPRG